MFNDITKYTMSAMHQVHITFASYILPSNYKNLVVSKTVTHHLLSSLSVVKGKSIFVQLNSASEL